MKSVTICITNLQSGDTIALCIESIRKYTRYPHRVLVYDDATDESAYQDLVYLREIRNMGWIRLIEGKERVQHGPALSRMLETVTDDLAMIIDNDVQIFGHGWLEEMVEVQEKNDAALVVDLQGFSDNPVTLNSWFFMLDMHQYPFIKAEWHYTKRPDFIDWDKTPNALYPTGYRVWEKAHEQGRAVIPIPDSVRAKWRHYEHIAMLSMPQHGPEWDIRQKRYAKILAELKNLRAGR